jgi:hypothetical protein
MAEISLLIRGDNCVGDWKIADSVLLSLYMRGNEQLQHSSRPLAPARAVHQFPTFQTAGINDPEGPDKYYNTEVTLCKCNSTMLQSIMRIIFYV